VREVVAVGLAVARGLHHSHSAGVLHLDMKTGNIMLPWRGCPKAKIIDFGASVSRHGAPRTFVGTPAFASPEHLRLTPDLDPRSDLYSLGAVLFTALVGRKPFVGSAETNPAERWAPPVSHLRCDAPVRLCYLIQQLLADDRKKRPENAAAVIGRFQEVLATLTASPRASV
jgi:serine/threonine protein kinase